MRDQLADYTSEVKCERCGLSAVVWLTDGDDDAYDAAEEQLDWSFLGNEDDVPNGLFCEVCSDELLEPKFNRSHMENDYYPLRGY